MCTCILFMPVCVTESSDLYEIEKRLLQLLQLYYITRNLSDRFCTKNINIFCFIIGNANKYIH